MPGFMTRLEAPELTYLADEAATKERTATEPVEAT